MTERAKRKPTVNDEMLRQAEELAGFGLTLPQISAVLGFSERTIYRRQEENEALAAALERGRAKAAAAVGRALFHKASDGDVPAIRWWEMTREGRSERVQTQNQHEVVTDAATQARLAKLIAGAGQGETGTDATGDSPETDGAGA